ncbi:MAG: hypothetical protein GF332_01320 [Candidatus Moranbacteria bacterium]|nr:hypothetical protein [Candidatus Moranbacteria bacterium]
MHRKIKQILIILFYLLMFSGFIGFLYWYFTQPTCNDQKQNQGELGVDCGGPCAQTCQQNPDLEPLQVHDPEIISNQNNYDVVFYLKNDNSKYGFNQIQYDLNFFSGSEQLTCFRSGQTYILPNQDRPVVELNINCPKAPDQAKITINNQRLHEFKDYNRPSLEILNLDYQHTQTGGSYFEIIFQVVNRSDYSFKQIDIIAVVRDQNGQAIALNQGNINSVYTQDKRDFRFFWAEPFDGQVKYVDVEAFSDVFSLSNLVH